MTEGLLPQTPAFTSQSLSPLHGKEEARQRTDGSTARRPQGRQEGWVGPCEVPTSGGWSPLCTLRGLPFSLAGPGPHPSAGLNPRSQNKTTQP